MEKFSDTEILDFLDKVRLGKWRSFEISHVNGTWEVLFWEGYSHRSLACGETIREAITNAIRKSNESK